MEIKLHRPIILIIKRVLEEIFQDKRPADKCLEFAFKNNKQLGARDRALIAETVYEILRYFELYAYCANTRTNFWHIIASYFIIQDQKLPAWSEWQNLNIALIQKLYKEAQQQRLLRESIPEWLDELGQDELKNEWENILSALNKKADSVIRINTLKINNQDLQKKLFEANIPFQTIDQSEHALIIHKKNIFQSDLFKNGYFEMQDAASQLVAPFLDLQSGMRVIDACAGAGGKSLHISSLLQNKGYVISLDTEKWKLEELKKRAKRNGVSIIETRWIENNKVIKRLHESCDRLLLDVPCSGLGVLRRNPDAKWKLTKEFIEEVKKTQSSILDSYCKMLRPGGKMVYATCSILPSENQNQISTFLNKHKEFILEEEKTIWPHQFGFDGFYMARLKKINSTE
ncbi:MAG TPA: class I SAM-dependent methyltransferase [Saprospiraceae bacterium]|jgi:16S rRNA (cytosine967-C5)-methyltransferase|nr:class I SAM-dependent methyltransferase [Saprospiraceae bacterium]